MDAVMSRVLSEENRPTRHAVREHLKEMILSGRTSPGEKLRQIPLAKKLGVSQGVVREALLELAATGLVETSENRGSVVADLSPQKILDAYEIREMHEALVARRCCDRITRQQVREMREWAGRIYDLGAQGKVDEMARLDREWHHRLAEIAGNSFVLKLSETYRVFTKILRSDRDCAAVRDEHLAILDAIEAGDAAGAEQLMRAHVQSSRQYFEKLTREGKLPHWVR
jgi:DNA-binding GntR family transcriptional regulator